MTSMNALGPLGQFFIMIMILTASHLNYLRNCFSLTLSVASISVLANSFLFCFGVKLSMAKKTLKKYYLYLFVWIKYWRVSK